MLLYDTEKYALQSRLIGISERVQSVAFSPDGKKLAAVGGAPGRFGEVQVWDPTKEKLLVSAPVTFDTLYGVSWSPDGKTVAFGCADNTVRAIDAAHRQADAPDGHALRLGARHRRSRRTGSTSSRSAAT